MKYRDLTKGSISRSLLLFALPMIAGNLLQQFYNIADTLIVGRVPEEIWDGMRQYLLIFLAFSAVLNIGLDILFVAVLPWGIAGAGSFCRTEKACILTKEFYGKSEIFLP